MTTEPTGYVNIDKLNERINRIHAALDAGPREDIEVHLPGPRPYRGGTIRFQETETKLLCQWDHPDHTSQGIAARNKELEDPGFYNYFITEANLAVKRGADALLDTTPGGTPEGP